ncbi:unnamed protein product [Arabidopsis thaliana]|uniref:F-box domain-containing protein n=1 Tax=Arabidopsis thaliana TaxID=3702 RepID=A0A5S9WQR9_ARATH|nr:unnamed protein product [Arabidopsis thaliana]
MVSVNLPWELVEEILYRVPPQSLARFRTVCKQWNSLFDDNKFVNDHLVRSRPQFMFRTDSKMYSIAVNFSGPWIEVHELILDIPGYDNKKRYKVLDYEFEPSSKLTIYEIGLYSKKVKDLESDSSWSVVQSNSVSLNGTLYWAGVDVNNCIFIRSFSFSTERLTTFCRLPLKYNEDNILALAGGRIRRGRGVDKTHDSVNT